MSVSNTTLTILFLLIPDNRTNNKGGRQREAPVGVLLGFVQCKRLEGRDSSSGCSSQHPPLPRRRTYEGERLADKHENKGDKPQIKIK